MILDQEEMDGLQQFLELYLNILGYNSVIYCCCLAMTLLEMCITGKLYLSEIHCNV